MFSVKERYTVLGESVESWYHIKEIRDGPLEADNMLELRFEDSLGVYQVKAKENLIKRELYMKRSYLGKDHGIIQN